MIHLTLKREGDSALGISKGIGIERIHAQKILRQLRQGDLVTSTLGSAGGFALAREPETISLLDIITVMEKSVYINRCLEEDHFCNLTRTDYCPVRKAYVKLQQQIEDYLGSCTLTKLVEDLNNPSEE